MVTKNKVGFVPVLRFGVTDNVKYAKKGDPDPLPPFRSNALAKAGSMKCYDAVMRFVRVAAKPRIIFLGLTNSKAHIQTGALFSQARGSSVDLINILGVQSGKDSTWLSLHNSTQRNHPEMYTETHYNYLRA